MCKIISEDNKNHTATVEVQWFDLDLFIEKYDSYAGQALRDNDIERAMMWSKKATEFLFLRKKLSDNIK